MLYDAYKKKMLNLAKVLKKVKKILICTLIVAAVGLALAAVAELLMGILLSNVSCPDVEYGNVPVCSAKALFCDPEYEFRYPDGEWKSDVPTEAGTYYVKGVTVNNFGIERETKTHQFSITPKTLYVNVPTREWEYGDEIPLSAEVLSVNGLVFTDKITFAEFESESTVPGETSVKIKDGSLIISNDDGKNVTDSYKVIIRYGYYTIQRRAMTITVGSATKQYDSKPLTCDSYSIEKGSLVPGHTIHAEITGSQTEMGESKNIGVFKITDGGGQDVTGYYRLTINDGKLTVTKRIIEIETGSAQKEYDGTPLTCREYNVISANLVDGHYIEVTCTGSQVYFGTGKNTAIVKVFDQNKNNVTSSYLIYVKEGTLSISKRKISITTGSASKIYDGMELECREYKITSGSLASSDSMIITSSSKIIDVGSRRNDLGFLILAPSKINVSDCYEIEMTYGTLEILPREIEITTESATKEYDGKPLTNNEWSISNGSVAPNQRIEVEVTGSQTEVGKSDNTAEAKVFDANESDVTKNYSITYKLGTLEVIPTSKIIITIQTASAEKRYDGTPLTKKEYSIVEGEIAAGDRCEVEITGSQTEVGWSYNTANVKIYADNGRDVTDNYLISVYYGILNVYDGFKLFNFSIGLMGEGDPICFIKSTADGEYLREQSYGDYTGDGFLFVSDPYTKNDIFSYQARELGKNSETQTIEITYLKGAGSIISPYYYLNSIFKTDDTQIFGSSESYIIYYVPELNGQIDSSIEKEYRKYVYETYLSIPDSTKEGLLEIAKNAGLTSESSIEQIADYIRNAAEERSDYLIPPGVDFVLYFLNVEKKGACAHFAAAGTMMFRALGIPARFTLGRHVRFFANVEKSIPPISRDTWVEVYIDGFGWMPVDVTGSRSDDGESGGRGTSGFSLNGSLARHGIDPISEPDLIVLSTVNGGLLRGGSFGDYDGNGFLPVADPYTSSEMLSYQARVIGGEMHSIKIEWLNGNDTILTPYYYYKSSFESNDTMILGNAEEYEIGFVPGITGKTNTNEEKEYREYVYKTYLSVPETTKTELMKIIGEAGLSSESSIDDIANYVRNAAEYSYDFDIPEGEDFVIYFLNVEKKGVCQNFAAAGTLIYRALGIPARYTVGYAGDYEANEESVITSDQAHAWVEVYIDGFGWMPIDVTAPSSISPDVEFRLDNDPPSSYPFLPEEDNIPEEDKIKITISTSSATKVYDGNPLRSFYFSISEGSLEEGHKMVVYLNDNYYLKSVGKIDNKIGGFRIFTDKGKDVTYLYSITFDYGTLEVLPREISIRAGSASKQYDGQVLTCPDYEIIYGDIPEWASITIVNDSKAKKKGITANSISEVIIYDTRNEINADITRDFSITLIDGLLLIY